jgi:hypothetical protein
MLEMQKHTWIGTATLLLSDANPKRSDGFVGAFAGFACIAEDIAAAVVAVCREFQEAGYVVIGLEHMLPVDRLDRDLTSYEKELLQAAEEYPVQFRDVHAHKGDG